MAGANINLAPSIIEWLFQKIQHDNQNSKVSEMINNWKSGEKVPTFNQVEEVSKKMCIPLGYFFLQTPPIEECKILEYRTVDSINIIEPSRNLIDTVDAMEDIQNWMRDYLIESGFEKLGFVGTGKNNSDVKDIADNIRKQIGIDITWFERCKDTSDGYNYIRGRMENAGILVLMNGVVGQNTRRSLNVKEFRAFTLIDQYAPLIFINTNDTAAGKLFSLFHEVAHIWLGIDNFYNDQYGNATQVSESEKICNAVAAEILVPMDNFKVSWNQIEGQSNFEIVVELAKKYSCSQSVVARRALDSKRITVDEYNRIIGENIRQYEEWMEAKKSKKSSGGNYYNTLQSRLDHRFVNAIYNSAQEGRTQYTEAYHLTHTNRSTFNKLVSEIRGRV